MTYGLRRVHAFSLVELTLSLGIAAFCLIGVFGLVPVGVQTNRNATSQTRATNIMAEVLADLRATPKTSGTWTGTSSQFCITLGTPTTLYFDSGGRCSKDPTGGTDACGFSSWDPVLQTRYRVNITFPLTGNLTYAQLKVTWPATADPATITPSGSAEIFAAFNRN
jgi:uncharacterized protein (TIGR02598 family)